MKVAANEEVARLLQGQLPPPAPLTGSGAAEDLTDALGSLRIVVLAPVAKFLTSHGIDDDVASSLAKLIESEYGGSKVEHLGMLDENDIKDCATSLGLKKIPAKLFFKSWVAAGGIVASAEDQALRVDVSVPATWDLATRDLFVPLLPGTELAGIMDAFSKTMNRSIAATAVVKRVQNTGLWERYTTLKMSMVSRAKREPPEIHGPVASYEHLWTFHGCTADVVKRIAQGGFNRSYAGRNACAYGLGVYFARDASYSAGHQYAVPDAAGVQRIFACRILVGEKDVGTQNSLPADRLPGVPFDSTVNRLQDPLLWVLYQDCQAYPEYLIEFKSA